MQVEAYRTPASADDVAYVLVQGGMPRAALHGAVTHLALEHGGLAFPYIWNNNPGNVKLTPAQKAAIGWDENTRTAAYPDGGDFNWFQLTDNKSSRDQRPNPYQAFDTLDANGFNGYIREIKRRPMVMAAFEAEDPSAMAYALYTDPGSLGAGAYIGCGDGHTPCNQSQLDAQIAEKAGIFADFLNQVQLAVTMPPIYVVSRTTQQIFLGVSAAVFGSVIAYAIIKRRRR